MRNTLLNRSSPLRIASLILAVIACLGTLLERSPVFAVNVHDFGAKGDAITDDTNAIRAALAASPRVHFPPGVYIISDGIDLPRGARLTGDGAPFLGAFPLADDKDLFAEDQRTQLPGTTLLFRGTATQTITTERSDRFNELRYAIRTKPRFNFSIEKLAIALDVTVKNPRGKFTTPQTDERSDCGVGLLIDDSAAGTVRDVNVFGYWKTAGLCIVSRGLGDNPDYNTFWNCSFMGDTGVALVGSDDAAGPGLSGTQFHGCRLFAADHHQRSSGHFGTTALFIDGETKGKRADLNGHSFFGGCIRTYNNHAVILDHASNLSFHGTVFEVPSYDGANSKGADKTGQIFGTEDTRDVFLFGCRMHDIGLNQLARAMQNGTVIAIPDRFRAMSVSQAGSTARLSANQRAATLQLTDDGNTTNSGKKIEHRQP